MRTLRRVTATAAIGLAVLLSAGHQASAQIKIGSVLSVTGPASFLGDPEKRTLEIYVEEINAKGGVNGQKLQLIVYDDGGSADNARTFATRLIEEDKIFAMVGGSTTGATLAMIPAFEDAKIPFISLAGAIQIIEPVRSWVFKTPHTDKMACEKIFANLKTRKLTTIALIAGTDAFGKSMRDQCVRPPKAGITIAPRRLRAARQRHDHSSPISCQAGVQCGEPGLAKARLCAQHRQLGIAVPLYQSHGVPRKFIDLAGAAAEGGGCPRPHFSWPPSFGSDKP